MYILRRSEYNSLVTSADVHSDGLADPEDRAVGEGEEGSGMPMIPVPI